MTKGDKPKEGRDYEYCDDIKFTEFFLVDHCIYCGSKDWSRLGTKTDGTECTHPNKMGGPLRELDDEKV